MKCNANIPAPCPFCGRELSQECLTQDMTDFQDRVVGRYAYIYWQHPEAEDCPLGFGLVLRNDADIIKQWNRRKK